MEKTAGGLTEETANGINPIDRTWMTTFWESFSDCVIETDAQYRITNILKKPESTFTMPNIIGMPFFDIAADKDRALAEREIEKLQSAAVPYLRFTFLSKLGRYYRWTLIAYRADGVFRGLRGIAVDVTRQSLNEITLNWQSAIIEGSSDFITITDLDGNALYTNPGAYKMTGYKPSMGPLPQERIFSPEHLEVIHGEGLEKALLTGFWSSLSELVCADGRLLPVEHNMFSVINEQDDTVFIATIIRDITDFVEREKSILNEQRRTELLASVAMSFSLADDFDAAVNEALASIGGYMGIDAMCIRRDNQESQCFITDYLWSNNDLYTANAAGDMPYIDTVTGGFTKEYTLLRSVPIFVSDDLSLLADDEFTMARSEGVRSLICLPIRADDQFWGYISLSMFTGSRSWTEGDIGFLKTICGILSTSLEKRLMSQRWQAAQADLQAVVRNYPGIIWSLDANRRFTLYDGAFPGVAEEKEFGIAGQNIHQYAIRRPGAIHPSMAEMVERTFLGEPQDWVMETKNAVFRCNTMPMGAEGNVTGVVGASVDVTGMIRMQKDLEEARVAAEAANVAKSEFLSRMSHEIRTPMNAIIGMTQIAKNSGDAERIRGCLDKIDGASKHLLALINDILDISKIEANKLELQNEIFDLEKCLLAIRGMIAVRLEEKKQAFDLRFSESLPRYVVSDELRFTQVIINLLGNAIKFTPEMGEISLEVSGRGCGNGECILELRVRDSGIGISPEQQKKLFRPFEQGDGSITREFGGTGLGLAICKNIVELMGGGIWVESVMGGGSLFAFTAKMRIGDEAAYEQARQAGQGTGPAAASNDLSQFTILLVEDVDINREIVYAILEDTRVNIDSAENGAKAVDMFATAPGKYNIVLMDLQMPVMDGIEASRRIRAIESTLRTESKKPLPAVPIMAMTANAFREDADKCRAAGMNDHIAKPIDSGLLLEKLTHYLFLGGNSGQSI